MNKDIQYKSREEIKSFQENKLREELDYLSANSAFYQRLFSDHNLDISKINTIEDLRLIPPTTKKDLQLYNNDFLCVDKSEVIDYVTTSGTLGDPVTFMLTSADLDRLAYNEYLSFSTAGCSKEDILQLMTTIDRRFMAGLAYFLGARDLGMGVVRVGNGIPELQWDTIRRVKPTCCIVVPSFLIKLAEYAEHNKIDLNTVSIKKAICIGEPLRCSDLSLNTLGERIKSIWNIPQMISTYASTEMQSSFTECECCKGGHHQPELIIVEFLDNNNNPVSEGEAGEVTITTLGVRGMPLLRFKTGDICYHYNEPCECGRTTMRLSPILGRKGQMIKYKGTTLYPPALYDILDNVEGIENYLVEVFTNEVGTDEIVIKIGSKDQSEAFAKQIKDLFRSKVRVAPSIQFEPTQLISKTQMPQMSRKPIKFIDLRDHFQIK